MLASKSVDTVSGFELIITADQPAPAERVRRLDRAVVELDPLPDPDGPEPITSAAGRGTGGSLGRRPGGGVGRVEVRRLGGELGGAGVDHRVARPQPERQPRRAEVRPASTPARAASSRSPKPARLAVASSAAAVGVGRVRQPRAESATSRSRPTARPNSARNHGCDPVAWMTASGTRRRSSARTRHSRVSDGARKRAGRSAPPRAPRAGSTRRLPVGVEPGDRRVVASGPSSPVDVRRVVAAAVARHRGEVVEARRPGRVLGQRPDARLLETAERLVERRAERPVDRHHLAGRLHLAAERAVGGRELVEREAGQLDDHVVERGLERGDGRAGHDVRDLGQPPAGGDLGGDAGDRIAGRLARQRRRAADPRD